MSDRYLVVGGYHDGEWHPCKYPETKLAESSEPLKITANDTLTAVDESIRQHVYKKQKFSFRGTFYGERYICVLAPANHDIDDTMRNLIDGYVPKKAE